ncbi:hypothetical protein EPN29_00745 [bacterium]|nr:MAG: hypothetical protein EPN29_00745 [bacterium]
MTRLLMLAAAAVTYLLAAWMVAPGFYDGFTPQQPYNWVCPPAQAASNQTPSGGRLDIKVIDGASDANSAFTNDGQVVIGFLPGAFDSTGKTDITVDITPVVPCPTPAGLHFATNVYKITASALLVKAANLVLRYSDLVPAPSDVYFAGDPGGPWRSIGAAQQAQPFTMDTSTKAFGYFAAGYPANAAPPPGSIRVGGGQLLPIAVAVLIVGVVVAGIPLAILRRRRDAGAGAEPDDDEAI